MREHLAKAHPDLVRSLLEAFVEALMGAEVDALCGAEYRRGSPERTNRRNGYRSRPWDTRLGTIEPKIPKLREGTYFPDWLPERRRRSLAGARSWREGSRGWCSSSLMPTRGSSMRSARPYLGSPGSGVAPTTCGICSPRWPSREQPWVATLVRTIFDQPDAQEVKAQFQRVVEALATKLPEAADHLEAAREDLLAFRHFR